MSDQHSHTPGPVMADNHLAVIEKRPDYIITIDCRECFGDPMPLATVLAAAPETAAERDRLKDDLEKEREQVRYWKGTADELSSEATDWREAAEKAEKQRDELLAASKKVMTFYMGIIVGATGDATREALLGLQVAIASVEQP